MMYFAYGSNVNLDHLRPYLDTHGVDPDAIANPGRVTLHNFALRTNYFSGTHGAGVCNVEPVPSCCVEGVIMTITPAVQDALRLEEA